MERAIRKDSLIAFILFALAFGYYYMLCAKSYTWMFASFDSGDWLASSQIWMVPQPYGSPLYILLGHGVNSITTCPCNLVQTMTVILSVIPASITVAVVYLIIKKLGYSTRLAATGACILMVCGIFLSQATVLEEYAIATMFVTLAFYFYVPKREHIEFGDYKIFDEKEFEKEHKRIKRDRYLTLLFLGLGSAVHIIVVPITVLWLIVHIKEWRKLVKPLAVYIAICAGFYSLILGLMASHVPNLIAGDLSFQGINNYLGSTETIGNISLHDTPVRLLQAGSVLLLGFGVCLVPLVWGFKRPWQNVHKVMFLTVVFCAWLYLTNTDMTTWTFMVFAIPIAVVAIVIGLSKMPRWCTTVAVCWIACMLIVNGVWFNASVLSKENNEPQQFYKATMQIPDGSAVLCNRGGAYGMGVIYAIASGKNIAPLFLQTEEAWDTTGYLDYLEWMQEDNHIEGDNWIEQTDYCLDTGGKVYVSYYILPPEWQDRIDVWFESIGFNEYYREVVEVYKVPHYILN